MTSNPTKIKIGDKIYNINTSFKVALRCNEIALDETIDDYERGMAIIYLLYGEEGLNDEKNYGKLLKMAQKYFSMNKEDAELCTNEPDMDYIQDWDFIKASFMSDYHIDLDKQDLHWWEFFNLLNGLSNSEMGNCCILNRIRNLRRMDTSKIKDLKTREEINKQKRLFALKRKEHKPNDKQKESSDNFYKSIGL